LLVGSGRLALAQTATKVLAGVDMTPDVKQHR
jgi:hypothetical protein